MRAAECDSLCANGECTAEQCEGWHDVDGLQPNGWEYVPCRTNGEACDGLDNDCDGLIDEGFAALDDEPDTLARTPLGWRGRTIAFHLWLPTETIETMD